MKKISLAVALTAFSSALISANSPYISKVYEFRPAPGQFINSIPEIDPADSEKAVCDKVLEQIGGDRNPGLISLGAFGGYVVFGFDHPVVNVRNAFDFKIYGNAIISDRDRRGGSCEPGIVMVSRDVNKNGLPDDPWYELAGSDYGKETTLKNFKITYYKPEANHQPTPDPTSKNVTDTKYIRWTASDGTEGYVTKNSFHTQSYWPEWMKSDSLKFTGTRLEPNSEDVSGNGSYFVLRQLDWGYADNQPNNDPDFKGFDISWAVDGNGHKTDLPSIDFVKVHTGINNCNGWLGETSTEIAGAEDLHPAADPNVGVDEIITTDRNKDLNTYDLFGRRADKLIPGNIYVRGGKKFIAK